eukprot:4587237-Karenia_brevis.AAC.1
MGRAVRPQGRAAHSREGQPTHREGWPTQRKGSPAKGKGRLCLAALNEFHAVRQRSGLFEFASRRIEQKPLRQQNSTGTGRHNGGKESMQRPGGRPIASVWLPG